MFSGARRHFNAGTVVAIVALVFAMTGGAFAVAGKNGNGHATAVAANKKKKSKAKVLRGPRGPQGLPGPAGAPGAPGKEGAAGKEGPIGKEGKQGIQGLEGKAGTPGIAGESVVSSSLSPGQEGCTEGGSKFTVGAKTTTACNGEKGEPGSPASFPAALPEGATETGVGTVAFKAEEETVVVPISFPIQLPLAVENFHYVSNAEQEAHTGPTQCSGSAEKPTAAKNNLCAYEAGFVEGKFEILSMIGPTTGGDSFSTSNVAGAVLFTGLVKEPGGEPLGPEVIQFVWAVSAP